jgi:hypothetical protein
VDVGLNLSATVTCDKCGIKKTAAKVTITKLKPSVEMHLVMPEGWGVSSLLESGDMFINCPTCPPTLVSIPPVPIVDLEDVVEDPATDPTLRPPPLPKV